MSEKYLIFEISHVQLKKNFLNSLTLRYKK